MAKNILVTVKGAAFIRGGGVAGNTSREIKGVMVGVSKELKKQFIEEVADAAAEAAAKVVLKKSLEYVPIDTHLLEESGRTNKIKDGSWSVSYGSNASGFYATIVHETMEIDGAAAGPPRGGKYITRAAQDTQKEQETAINKAAKKAMKKIGK